MTAPVYVVDDVIAQPGEGRRLLERYLAEYAPGVSARGLTLVHQLVEPAYWLDDGSNRLLLIWSAADPRALWAAKHAARRDPAVVAWWDERAAPLLVSRRRGTAAEAGDLDELADV